MKPEDKIGRREFVSFLPESLANDSLDGIAGYRERRESLGDYKPKPGTFGGRNSGVGPGRRYNEQRPSGNASTL